MAVFKVKFQALNVNVEFVLKTKRKAAMLAFKNDLFNLFVDEKAIQTGVIQGLQFNSSNFRRQLDLFVDFYSKGIPQVNGLRTFFKGLKENEEFYFLPGRLSTKKNDDIFFGLKARSEGKTLIDVKAEMFTLVGNVPKRYNVGVFGGERIKIGKKGEYCRFCNETKKTFNLKAHAISEGLGNKAVILLEECDSCNERFSRIIEPDIISYLSLFRTMYGVKTKRGEAVYKGANFIMRRVDGQVNITFLSGAPEISEKNYLIPLKTYDKIVSQNIYKCLCKYFLSVIDKKYIKYFENTIAWINGTIAIDKLPMVAEIIDNRSYADQPRIRTYIKKRKSKTIPFAVGELLFTCKRLVFIVPGVANQNLFLSEKEYNTFWKMFKIYSGIEGWGFHDYSLNKKRQLEIKLNADLTKIRKSIH